MLEYIVQIGANKGDDELTTIVKWYKSNLKKLCS